MNLKQVNYTYLMIPTRKNSYLEKIYSFKSKLYGYSQRIIEKTYFLNIGTPLDMTKYKNTN